MSSAVNQDVPFAAGVVGSLPRPRPVVDMLPEDPGEASADAARSPRMDAAVSYAIALQETAGLDLVSDGEWRRHAYTHIIALKTLPHGLRLQEARFVLGYRTSTWNA